MHIKIVINMDNAAFEDNGNGEEVASILADAIISVQGTELEVGDEITLRDSNGNRVGQLEVKKGSVKI